MTTHKGPLPEEFEKLAALLPEGYTVELVDGDIILHPFPTFQHARAITRITTALDPYDSDPHGWLILAGVGQVVPEGLRTMVNKNVVGPDVIGWRRERMPCAPDGNKTDIVANWVCEVLSTNENYDRAVKMPFYYALGVEHAWLVDPRVQTLEVFERGAAGWECVRKAGGSDSLVVPPFGLELSLARLWQR